VALLSIHIGRVYVRCVLRALCVRVFKGHLMYLDVSLRATVRLYCPM